MSREVPWRRSCPEVLKARIQEASQAHLYVVQEQGPMAFVLRDDSDRSSASNAKPADASNEGSTTGTITGSERRASLNSLATKVKVGLGSRHTCTCSTFTGESELCIHILWVMIKMFRVPLESDLLFQHSLVEREISEIMQSSRRRKEMITPAKVVEPSQGQIENKNHVPRRPIEDGDVCPICQEDLIEDPVTTTYCKMSCGNNLHVKCMKILIEHQTKAMGMDNIKCPLCRKNFGTVDDLKKEFAEQSKSKSHHEMPEKHYGTACNECGACPIVGKLHRCIVCKSHNRSYFLCDKCFVDGAHSEHSFSHRQKRSSRKWVPSVRSVSSIVPDGIANDLQNRDLDDNDYELLLQLDKPSVQGSVPLHIVSTFPTVQLRRGHLLLAGGGQRCTICADNFKPMELARSIPCGHSFHQQCIDRWLIQQRATCPTCGTAAYHSLDGNIDDEAPTDSATYRSAIDFERQKKSGSRKKKSSGSRKTQSSEKDKAATPKDELPPGSMAIFGTRQQIGLPRIGGTGSLVGKTQEFLSPQLGEIPPLFQPRESEVRVSQRMVVVSPLPILPPLRKSFQNHTSSFHESSSSLGRNLRHTGDVREPVGGSDTLSFSDLMVTNHHPTVGHVAPAEGGSVYMDSDTMSNFSAAFGRGKSESESTIGRGLIPRFTPLHKNRRTKSRVQPLSRERSGADFQQASIARNRFDSMITGFGIRSNSSMFNSPR
ncbi:hypothetical protein BC829DRAFT_297983 [Chytridium lagenaria]|nr:hypothetical protein BC829DRAFT_297983 [Chytridium lagenaria]